jgi:hypothetical protein
VFDPVKFDLEADNIQQESVEASYLRIKNDNCIDKQDALENFNNVKAKNDNVQHSLRQTKDHQMVIGLQDRA